MSSPSVSAPRSISCPQCGGSVELRGLAHTLSAVCINCLSVIDTSTPQLQILQRFRAAERIKPKIPLGSRGKFENHPYELIGFQVRQITVDGVAYQWHEYLLFNPYQGFRYLSEYNGHWNFIETLNSLPQAQNGVRPAVAWNDSTFKHFQAAQAETVYVMGEFPWRVEVGDKVNVNDYISPPRMLSSESVANETTWSLGRYTAKQDIEKAFDLKQPLPAPTGVFANQPAPVADIASAWKTFIFLLVLAIAGAIAFGMSSRDEKVFEKTYTYVNNKTGEASFVTDIFELKGRTSNVEVRTQTDLNNSWVFLNFALINAETGRTWDFGREIGYYTGRDSDGAWSEGSQSDDVTIPQVPSGRYYLRVEPEMDETRRGVVPLAVNYTIGVRRDVPSYALFFLVIPFLAIPAIWRTIRRAAFETQRWAESDYAPDSTGSTSDDDD